MYVYTHKNHCSDLFSYFNTCSFHPFANCNWCKLRSLFLTLQSLDTLRDETVGNLDLILKWFTVRFLDTNPSMLNKALEYLRQVLTMLVEMDYSLHEYEATSFIPYLIIKVSRPGALSIYVASPATSLANSATLPYVTRITSQRRAFH